jgi:hypothetical protein
MCQVSGRQDRLREPTPGQSEGSQRHVEPGSDRSSSLAPAGNQHVSAEHGRAPTLWQIAHAGVVEAIAPGPYRTVANEES